MPGSIRKQGNDRRKKIPVLSDFLDQRLFATYRLYMTFKSLWQKISGTYWYPVIVYSIFGILWIKLSDYALFLLVPNREMLAALQTWKGWFFILVTALLLLILVRRHQKLILKQQNQQEWILSNVSIPMVQLDLKGNITLINQSFSDTFGYSQADIPNQIAWFEKAYPDPVYREKVIKQWMDDSDHQNKDKGTLMEGKIFQVKDKWNKQHTVHFLILFRKDSIIVLCRDITEKLKDENQRIQEDKMRALGQLAGGIAHDFNNHLSAIMGYTDLLSGTVENEEEKQYLKQIIEAAETSAELTNQLLSYSRKNREELVPVNMKNLIEEVASLGIHTFPKNIELLLEGEDRLDPVMGNPGMLKSMLLNLLINARDSMPDGGAIKVKYRQTNLPETQTNGFYLQAGKYLSIKVCDEGIGMEEEQLTRIFEPFYTTKVQKMGSGMGLAMVYSTLEKHQGAVEAESHIGKGSCFTLFLPCAAKKP